MKNLVNIILNGIFIFIVMLIAVAISTLAITRKINDYSDQYKYSLSGTVVKKPVPVISFTKGLVQKISVQTGDEVHKGEILILLTNPPLESEVEVLRKFPDNVSAQTQLKVDEEQLKLLTIKAPSDGIVGDVNTSEGAAVDTFTKLLTIYSNDNIQFLANLTVDQYQAVKRSSLIKAYSQRLNQSFTIEPRVVNPNTKDPLQSEQKKIGLYFKFKNNKDAVSLLNNEDMGVQIKDDTAGAKSAKPIDLIVKFWNSILPPK